MFPSSRKRLHSSSSINSSPSHEYQSSQKRHRSSIEQQPEGYLEFCWRKICDLFGFRGMENTTEERVNTEGEPPSSSSGVLLDESQSHPRVFVPRSPSCKSFSSSSSTSQGIEIIKEIRFKRSELAQCSSKEPYSPLRSRPSYTMVTKEKKIKDKELNTPSSVIHSIKHASPHERTYSVHSHVFHPKLGRDRRSSLLRNFNSPARSNGSFNGLLSSVRLEEKNRYQKLISEYGTQTIKDLVNNGLSPISTTSKPSAVVNLMKSYDDAADDELPVVVAESTPIVKPRNFSKDNDVVEILERYVKKDSSIPLTISSSSASVLNKKPKVNSLDVELSKSPSYNDDFLRNLMDKYSSRSRERERQIRTETAKKEYYGEKNSKSIKIIEDRIKKHLTITEIEIELPEEEEEDVKLPEITEEMSIAIKKAFASDGRTLIHQYDTEITRKDIETLKGLNWLNDGVIHFYLQMIVRRSANSEKLPKVYAFNTFFYPKLMNGGHQPLRRWTRKVDLFSYDILLVPVHLGVHWCIATIDFRKPGINYYDSMGGNNTACLDALSKYLEDEHLDKKKSPYVTSKFQKLIVKDMPQQMNGSDCGMFSCKTAEYVSRGVPLSFTQKDMPYFRERMVYEIVTNTLLHP